MTLPSRRPMRDIYVLGSGATLSHIKPRFFDGKTIIATNRAAQRLGLYERECNVITHTHYHHDDAYPLAEMYPNHSFYAPEGDQGFEGKPDQPMPNIHFYPHPPTRFDFNVDEAVHPDGFIVGSSSIHGSMHIAAVMGASTILLVGADCGMLDGSANMDGYQSGNLIVDEPHMWLDRWEQHLRMVKAWLQDHYDVDIHSINPFLNLNLEGHEWS
jgi:hypothetical protein